MIHTFVSMNKLYTCVTLALMQDALFKVTSD